MKTIAYDIADERQKIWELVKDIDFALMVTRDLEGKLHARPMSTQKPDEDERPFDGRLWFLTDVSTPKAVEIRNDPHVMLNYADTQKQSYVVVAGIAQIIQDSDLVKEFWQKSHETWFPGGPEDPNIGVIRVDITGAEYWDSPANPAAYAYGYLKSKMTGQSYDPGENKKVNFT